MDAVGEDSDAVSTTSHPPSTSKGPLERRLASKPEGLRRTKSKSYKNVFKGSVLVSTLMDHDTSRFTNRDAAVKFAQRLLDAGHIESIVGAAQFEDGVHLFRWSDETVVREAKKMVSTMSSAHIPRKKLIELVDLHKGEGGEDAFVMKDVKDALYARRGSGSRRVVSPAVQEAGRLSQERGRRRQTVDTAHLTDSTSETEQELTRSNSLTQEQFLGAHEFSNRLRQASSASSSNEILTVSSPRRGSISDTSQTDTEKVRSPIRSPVAQSPVRVCSPELSTANDDLPEMARAINVVREDEQGEMEDSREQGESGGNNQDNTCRYDGVDMPALDLENLDFDSVRSRSLSNAADTLSVVDPSLESLSEPGNCYSDNEKQLLEKMKKMQMEHTNTVKSYEGQISDLVAGMQHLKQRADNLEEQRKDQEYRQNGEVDHGSHISSTATSNSSLSTITAPTPPPLPPPPPPPMLNMLAMRLAKPSKAAIKPRVKMRPLFWNRIIIDTKKKKTDEEKIETFWDSATEPNFDVDEFEKFFGKEAGAESARARSLHEAMSAAKGRAKIQSAKLLEENRSRAVAIKMRSLHCNMADIQTALYGMDFTKIDQDSLFSLYEIRGTKEELDKINTHLQAHEDVGLDQPEEFLLALSQMSHFPERMECLMLRKRFNETLFDIDQQLSKVHVACEEIRLSDHIRLIMEMVLAFGNYMNGGTQRGQADGFDLSIIPKLKDVKSMDNNLTLLQYVVRVVTREYEDDVGRNEAIFKLPDPEIMHYAAQVSFVDVDVELNSLSHQLTTHQKKCELVCQDTEPELLQPFKDKMDDFFDSADDMLSSQQIKLSDIKAQFHCLLKYLAVKDVTEQINPESFFGMWNSFIEDYKDYWVKEQKRIAKKMFEKVEQRRKARIRSAKRRKSEIDGGKSHLKQKFDRRRQQLDPTNGNSPPSTIRLLRSQSGTPGDEKQDVFYDERSRNSAPPNIGDDRPRRRRQRQQLDTGAAQAHDTTAAGSETGSGVVHNETMAQRMQRRRQRRQMGEQDGGVSTEGQMQDIGDVVASSEMLVNSSESDLYVRSRVTGEDYGQSSRRQSAEDMTSRSRGEDRSVARHVRARGMSEDAGVAEENAARRRPRATSAESRGQPTQNEAGKLSDAESLAQRRLQRRQARLDAQNKTDVTSQDVTSQNTSQNNNSPQSMMSRHSNYRETQDTSDSSGRARLNRPRSRGNLLDQAESEVNNNPDKSQYGTRDLMRKFQDRGGQASVKKSDLFNKS